MKNKTYIKNILRDMVSSKGKLLSIFIMILLSASVVVGLFLTGPSMRESLNNTLREFDHPDIVVSSTYGLTDEDQAIIEREDDIDKIVYTKSLDVINGDNLIRLKSFSSDLSKIKIVEGRNIKNKNEIVLDAILKDKYKIGEKIDFSALKGQEIDENLKEISYKIVGFANSSDYLFEDIRDMSLQGKKMIDGFAIIDKDNFKGDKFSEANISYKSLDGLDMSSDNYNELVNEKKTSLKDSLKDRPELSLKEIKDEANTEIKKGENEISDAKKELSDGEKELEDAKVALEDGFKEYEDGKKEFESQILSATKKLESAKNELDSGEKQLSEGKKTYEESKETFDKEIKAQEDKIKDAKVQINQGFEQYNKSNEEYEKNLSNVENAFKGQKENLETSKNGLDSLKASLDEQKETYDNLLKKIDEIKKENPNDESLLALEKQKVELSATISSLESTYNENKNIYDNGLKEFEKAYNEAKKPLDEGKAELDNQKIVLDQKNSELKSGEEKLSREKYAGNERLKAALLEITASEEKLKQGQIEYEEGLKTLEESKASGSKELKDSYSKLLDGQEKYKDSKKEFDEKRTDAKKDITDGEKELNDSKKTILKLVDPVYSVDTPRDNEAISTYYKNSKNIDELSKVFPVFFYAVAILVTLTSMKRYIEEERIHTGTLKSLGYSNKDIADKFYIYGLVPTAFGALAGDIIARFGLTKVIINAYSSGFELSNIVYAPSLFLILFTIFLSSLIIYLTIFITNRATVKEVPANLLREKPPKKGARIFLEKIKFIWSKLSFMYKITFRNLFRYKSRMLMTLFGVGGCTALIFFGFAMQDAITDTSSIQKNEITHYSMMVIYDPNADTEDEEKYDDLIKNTENEKIYYQDGKIYLDDDNIDVKILAVKNKDNLRKFINLRNLKKKDISLSDSGVTITENIAKKNKLKVGDDFEFEDKDGKIRTVKVDSIAENYINDYIYFSNEEYKNVFGEYPEYNGNFFVDTKDDLEDKLENLDAVNAIVKPNSSYDTIDVLMSNLNLVIFIITLISSLLAIVVLYNLTNINVTERMRELATTKVLGFYPRETTAYIYRESLILTVIGIGLGYILGYAMFRYILDVVSPKGILIAYHPHIKAYIISFAITMAISLIIMIMVYKRLKNIDMAKAMKSGE